MSAQGCGCGCSTMTVVTEAAEPCACGCECCAEHEKSRDEEIAELHALRESVDKRLSELSAG